jgi:hypothetical protein
MEVIMGRSKAFGLQSLIFCLLFNGLLVACLYWMATQAFPGGDDGVALGGVRAFLDANRTLLAPLVFGFGGLLTVFLWLSVQVAARRILGQEPGAVEQAARPSEEPLKQEVKRLEREVQTVRKAASRPSPGPAIQVLSILQRQGRLVDFLQEDLGLYEDGQIGAAVRSIHQGCKEALSQNVGLETVYGEEEGTEVTIEPGFDPKAVRLTGNVRGDPPFRGILRHRGWRVVRMDLPLKSPDKEIDWILAPAEIEIGE